MKIPKFLLTGVMVLALSGVCRLEVQAWDKSKPFNPKDVSSWNQTSEGFPENDSLTLGTSGKTVHRAGCGYFALSSVMVKCGYMDPEKETPIDLIKKANKGDVTEADSGGWHLDFNKVSYFNENLSCVNKQILLNDRTIDEALAYVKKQYLEGYFVLICVVSPGVTGGHYLFVDGYDEDGDMIITDSAFNGTKWSTTYGANPGTYIHYIVVLKDKTKKCNKLPSVYDESANRGNASGEDGEVSSSKSAELFLDIIKGYSDDIAEHEKEGIYWVYCNSGCKLTYDKVLATAKEGEMVNGKRVHRVKVNCAQIVDWALVDIGIFEDGMKLWGKADNTVQYVNGAKEALEKWCDVREYGANGKTASQLEEEGLLVAGDICTWGSADYGGPHTNVYAGDGQWYDAGRGGPTYTANKYPDIPAKDLLSGKNAIFTSLGPCSSVNMNTKPTAVIHINDYEGLTQEEKKMVDAIESEWELTGMPDEFKLSDTQIDLLLDELSLSGSEAENVAEIRNNIENQKFDIWNVVRAVVVGAGLVCMVYGVLIAVCGVFDLVSVFSINLLGVITLGRWRMIPWGIKDYHPNDGGKYLRIRDLALRVLILLVIGGVLVSGLAFRWALNLYNILY